MRLAIMGAGSLGMILGAHIQKNGQDIDLIDVNKDHVNALNTNGASVIGTKEFNVPVTALTPEDMEGEYDLIFYLVKQTHNESALNSILPHLAKDGIVATLQNGYPEPEVAKIVGDDRVVGVTVGWGATWIKPGVSELTTTPDKLTFDVGEYKGGITDRILKIKKILELMGPVNVEEDLVGARWGKLNINATFSGMSAALGSTFAQVMDNDKALTIVEHIGNELITVADKAGIRVGPFQGFDQHTLFKFTENTDFDKLGEQYRSMMKAHRSLRASMLQDLEKGYKTEIDAINGIVCKYGDKYGIPTPANDKVVEIVKGIEEGKYKAEFSNLDLFDLSKL